MNFYPESELLDLSQQLLDSIDQQDWKNYTDLCDRGLTAYEPEALGQLVTGMPFHEFYFKLSGAGTPKQSTINSPQVRICGEMAVVTYVRLIQSLDSEGRPQSSACEETRVWERKEGAWQHTHFHRSQAGHINL